MTRRRRVGIMASKKVPLPKPKPLLGRLAAAKVEGKEERAIKTGRKGK